MTQWTSPAQPVRCIVDLTAPLTVRRERGVLVQGDKNANAIVVEAYQGKDVPYDLTGSTVTLTFVRPDKLAVSPIKAEITGNVAVMTLTEACYRYSGLYAASVELHNGETDRTIVRVLGDIISTENDGVVDEEQIFPTPEELLETLLKVEQARVNAETAANRANTAAARAEQLQIDASGLAGDSNKLGGKPPEAYTAVNLLDNSYFIDAINQREITSANYLQYIIDRWCAFGSGQEGAEVTFNSNGMVFVSGRMTQRIPITKIKDGQYYTIAVYYADGTLAVKSGLVDYSKYLGQYYDFIAIYNELTATVSIRGSNEVIEVTIGETEGKTIMAVALYEGTYTAETLPPFVPPDPVVELAKCQHYVQRIDIDTWASFGNGVSLAAGYLEMIIPLNGMRTDAVPDVLLPASGLYIDGIGSMPLSASVTIVRCMGSYLFLQLSDPQFTAGHHSISTRETAVSVLIDNEL